MCTDPSCASNDFSTVISIVSFHEGDIDLPYSYIFYLHHLSSKTNA